MGCPHYVFIQFMISFEVSFAEGNFSSLAPWYHVSCIMCTEIRDVAILVAYERVNPSVKLRVSSFAS